MTAAGSCLRIALGFAGQTDERRLRDALRATAPSGGR